MATIIPKLNLNKTPNLVENNSLVFAKNIRLDVDGTIHKDYGILPLSFKKDIESDYLIDYENLLNRIIEDIDISIFDDIKTDLINLTNPEIKNRAYKIVGIIPDSNNFYIFFHGKYKENDTFKYINAIIKFNEIEDKFSICNCAWKWSGGTITGNVIKNLVGDTILNIGESDTIDTVLFKSINLTHSSINDDESIYTQIPKIPITNLNYGGTFSYVIPNGVYQFFVRYEIRKDFYTDWFPASNELFIGNKNNVSTSFGSLTYTNTHRDSDNSFVLKVEHLIEKNKSNYKSFQIGFLLSHDDTVYARAWKHFDLNNVTTINFDYKTEDAIEIETTDLLKVSYGLYNVGNIASFKNKLYISNYTESDFNDVSLQEYANKIDISLETQSGGNSYDGHELMTATVGGNNVIPGLNIDGSDILFYNDNGDDGIFKKICINKSNTNTITIEEAISKIINNENHPNLIVDDLYGIRIIPRFDTLTNAKNKIKQTYTNVITETIRTEYNIEFENDEINKCTINGKSSNISSDEILNAVYSRRYLNYNAEWVNVNNNIDDTIKVVLYRTVKITKTTTYYNNGGFLPINPGNNEIVDDLNKPTNTTTTKQEFNIDYPQVLEFQFVAWYDKLKYDDSAFLTNYTTLIPYQKYKFYIHYVKESGEISNGFECTKPGEIEAPYMSDCFVIYPKFSNIEIPKGYSACFFSICHTKVNSATIFNISGKEEDLLKEGSCFDINMLLIPGYKNLHIKQEIKGILTETYSGTYYHSSDPSLPKYFGANGVITFDKTNISNDKLAYVVNDYSISENNDLQLIKCTPYLCDLNTENSKDALGIIQQDKRSYNQFTNMNLIGYICAITPLDRQRCIQYYSDGSSVFYKKNLEYTDDTGSLNLVELSKYEDSNVTSDQKLRNFGLKTSNDKFVYSNYNLNFVTLSEEPKLSIKTYYNRASNTSSSATESEANNTNSVLLKLIPSQLMSDIYTLPSMYKTYTRKTYSVYSENETTRFDNTIRSSILYGDENKVNVLAFDANDYYNVPTNRGIIVNLLAVGDSILVHTKDSMFKFTGSNNLQSSNGEIQPTETQPFNTGISEVFGSDFGFAGLQYKTDAIVTEQGYIFFDRDSRIIYMYSGQGQIIKISESIEKLFRHRDIANIYFANDFYNNRFFVSILFYDVSYTKNEDTGNVNIDYTYYPVTLSFNIHKDIKSFVSLHDFYYTKAFNTKNNCYFLNTSSKNIHTINKTHKGCYHGLGITENVNKLFPYIKSPKNIIIKKYNNNGELLNKKINSYDSIIDVIDNTNFETVKTLNAVNWCSNIIDSEYKNIDESDISTLRMAEDINAEYPCKSFRVYTDTCMTDLLNFKNISNDYNLMSADSYKAPRYNQGFWTTNYFRNILNTKNKTTNYISDENSLIEGKYFVIRFVFDDEFKLETISLNYNTKL